MALPPREQSVVDALGDGSLSFQGLKRILGLHPQALSRVLSRLVRAGVIEKEEAGYRLSIVPVPESGVLPAIPMNRYAVLAAILLPDESSRAKIQELAGRWFRNLRWLGTARAGDALVLAWHVEPYGILLRVVVEGRHVRVEVQEECRDAPSVHEGVHAVLPAISHAITPRALMLAA